MNAIQKVIALAESEIGYREKASNANLDDKTANAGTANYTKYARDLDKITGFYNGGKNGYAWCDVFFDWLFYKSFGAALAMRMLYQPNYSAGAGCLYSAQYYKNNGKFTNVPAAGHQIFFSYKAGEVSHTGLVVAVDANNVYTIEGNTSDGVYKRTYNRNNGNIYGYGIPNYALADAAETVDEPTTETPVTTTPSTPATTPAASTPVSTVTYKLDFPLLKKGSTGDLVETVQALLQYHGYNLGKWGCDGDFGNDTEKAVKEFQKAHYLEDDGEVGGMTFKVLFGLKS